MQIAGAEASKSIVAYKHGCVAVVSGKIVAKGFNNYRTYSRDGLINQTCSCHAEIDVLRKCKKRNITKKITLYIARIMQNDPYTLNISRPCKECYHIMKSFNIKRLVYSDRCGQIVNNNMIDFVSTFTSSGQAAISQSRVKLF
jgi:tRNA(Arg) A34 adenosine deaminase TadA